MQQPQMFPLIPPADPLIPNPHQPLLPKMHSSDA